MSIICPAELTGKHILTECIHHILVKYAYYKNDIKKLFENVEIDEIIFYPKAVNKQKRYKNRLAELEHLKKDEVK